MACANADTPASQLTQEAAEAAVLCLINEQRAANGSPALTLNLKLRAAARQQANDAKTLKWWAGGGPQIHINPITGSTPKDRIKGAGYCPEEPAPPMNENGYDAWFQEGDDESGTTPRAAVTWWMRSQGHRTTLLDPAYRESGVAVVLGIAEKGSGPDSAVGGAIFVQTFGGCSKPETPDVGQGWNWGNNIKGQLGDGTTANQLTPVRPKNLSGVIAVAGGGYHSLALTSDGGVWAWGDNERGQLGDSTTSDRSTPVQVANLKGVAAIAGGGYHSLALASDGIVWAWGHNNYGQLGDSTTSDRSTPVQVANLKGVVAIAGGFNHSLALTNEGFIWAWGRNEYGQLGNGTVSNQSTPVRVGELSSVVAIAGGFSHSLALTRDGNILAWGANNCGQLGDSTLTDRIMPVKVHMSPGLTGVIVAIAAGGVHNLALEQNGRVWAWGGNAYGQLGNGDTYDRWLPVRPQYMYEVVDIKAGFGHSLVLKRDGSVWSWGANYSGQLGDGTTVDRYTQVQVIGLSAVLTIAGGLHHSLAP